SSFCLILNRKNTTGALICLFFLSAYANYFGIGIGQIIMAALIINGYSAYRTANAVKNAIISVTSVSSIIIFGISHNVVWGDAACMMIGAIIGGFLGGLLSRSVCHAIMRWTVSGIGFVMTIYYFTRDV